MPELSQGQASQRQKGEDFTLVKTECQRVLGDGVATYSVFEHLELIVVLASAQLFLKLHVSYNGFVSLFGWHNGSAAAIYAKENLLQNVLTAIPPDLNRDEWVAALPRALVAGFVKTDKDFQEREGMHITACGGEVGRLNAGGGTEIGPLRCWPGGLCLSRSIGDMDVGEYIVPVLMKQVKLTSAGGRLVLASDGVWDALSAQLLECGGQGNACKMLQLLKLLKKPYSQKKDFCEPDVVEELFEEGSASLCDRFANWNSIPFGDIGAQMEDIAVSD
ncbi:hypothetical protein HAX54_015873 [Datura stramonium]|uniref:PPM-type phosphatase domain-containing protein n=1 Tax=Datura stramonium TaxID=4076 RepID=A0ABS8UJM4_DATST|nr:hypothetical protein [Datura stramonium]